MKSALHIRTTGFYCRACPLVVEKAIGSMRGVSDVTAVRSMGLTSVLYDPALIDAATLCARIRSAGFGAEIYCPTSREAPQGQPAISSCTLGNGHEIGTL